MADSKLSDLSAAASLATTDLFYVVKTAGSGGVKATLSQLGTLYAGLGANTFTGIQSIPAGSKTSPTITFPQSITNGFYSAGDYDIRLAYNGKTAVRFSNTVLRVLDSNENQNIALDGQNAQIILGQSEDIKIIRDASGTLAQRNGANAQTMRTYRSFTDLSNFSRLTHGWNTTTALVMAEGAGTGSDGSVAFNDAALATNATVGFVMIPSCAGTPSGTPADIPTGQIPLVWDSTNLKLYAYTGGTWKSSAAFT